MLNQERTFTPSEAAVVSGVPVKTVHREIDEGPLKPKRRRPGARERSANRTSSTWPQRRVLIRAWSNSPVRAKISFTMAIIVYWRSKKPAKKELPVFGGRLLLDLKLVLEEVRSRLERLERQNNGR